MCSTSDSSRTKVNLSLGINKGYTYNVANCKVGKCYRLVHSWELFTTVLLLVLVKVSLDIQIHKHCFPDTLKQIWG